MLRPELEPSYLYLYSCFTFKDYVPLKEINVFQEKRTQLLVEKKKKYKMCKLYIFSLIKNNDNEVFPRPNIIDYTVLQTCSFYIY